MLHMQYASLEHASVWV